MSLSKIKNTVENFVLEDNNDALAIRGKYGVGKTYFWQKLVEVKSDGKPYYIGFIQGKGKDREIGKKHYIYLSLFGVDSLKSLKNSLFAEMVYSKDVASKTNKVSSFSKKVLNKLEDIPHIQKFTGDLVSTITFQDVRDALICFDDLDRKSVSLTITEIIGLANLLKEQHNCKIVLILNEDGFDEEKEKNEFRKQIEKLVDYEINFEPEAEEILKISFPDGAIENSEFIKACCRKLEIKNIRTIQKLKKYIEKISTEIKGLESEVVNDLLRSLCLFVFCHYNKEDLKIPSLNFLEDFGSAEFYFKKHSENKELSKDVESWEDFLRQYGYGVTDETDNLLLSFVRNGYLDTQLFNEKNQIKNQEIIKQNGVNKYHQAWDIYRESFENNEIEFVDQLFLGFQQNMKYLGIRQLQETITKLRQLGANDKANSLIDEYVENRIDIDSKRALTRGHIDFNIGDSYLKEKLENRIQELNENISIKDVLERFGSNGSYQFEDIDYLSTLTVDDFYNYFKSYNSSESQKNEFYFRDLYSQVKSCLQYAEAKDEPYKSIGLNSKKAIIKIALDYRINELRVTDWFSKEISVDEIQEAKKTE